MLSLIRRHTKPFQRAIGKGLAILPLNAIQFTFLAVPFSIVAAYFLSSEDYFLGTIFVTVAVLIDGFDGSFAEAKGQKSYFGNYWDAMVDKIIEAIIYLGFAYNNLRLAFLCFASSMLVSHAKARSGLVIVADNHDWPALGDRMDRLTLLVVGLIIANFIPNYTLEIVQWTLGTVAVIAFIGFVQRMLYAGRLIKKAEKEGNILPYLKK